MSHFPVSISYGAAKQRGEQCTKFLQMFGYDDRASSTLINSVYTPEITLDYDPLLLPDFQKKISSEQWAKRLENMHDHYDTTQHIVQ